MIWHNARWLRKCTKLLFRLINFVQNAVGPQVVNALFNASKTISDLGKN